MTNSTLFILAAAWVTNIFYSISISSNLLLVAGSLIPPVGIIGGVYCWIEFVF